MFDRFAGWVRALFSRAPLAAGSAVAPEGRDAAPLGAVDFAAIFAGKLSNMAFTDATMAVTARGLEDDGAALPLYRAGDLQEDTVSYKGRVGKSDDGITSHLHRAGAGGSDNGMASHLHRAGAGGSDNGMASHLHRAGARSGGSRIVGGPGDAPATRSDVVGGALSWAFERARLLTGQTLITGGVLLVPGVTGGRIRMAAVPQQRLYVFETAGEAPVSCAILAEAARQDGRDYYRFAGYALRDGNLEIRNRAVDASGRPVPLGTVEAWADIPADWAIAGAARMPFAHLKCPAVGRSWPGVYGRPILSGSEALVRQLNEHIDIIAREYRLTRPSITVGTPSDAPRYCLAASAGFAPGQPMTTALSPDCTGRYLTPRATAWRQARVSRRVSR